MAWNVGALLNGISLLWSADGAYIATSVGPDQPGFHHIVIHPYPAGDLTTVQASHKSMYGTIASAWKLDALSFTLNVTVPPKTSATIWMPAESAAAVTESGKAAGGAKGVKYVRSEGGSAIFEVESGSYSFKATL